MKVKDKLWGMQEHLKKEWVDVVVIEDHDRIVSVDATNNYDEALELVRHMVNVHNAYINSKCATEDPTA